MSALLILKRFCDIELLCGYVVSVSVKFVNSNYNFLYACCVADVHFSAVVNVRCFNVNFIYTFYNINLNHCSVADCKLSVVVYTALDVGKVFKSLVDLCQSVVYIILCCLCIIYYTLCIVQCSNKRFVGIYTVNILCVLKLFVTCGKLILCIISV